MPPFCFWYRSATPSHSIISTAPASSKPTGTQTEPFTTNLREFFRAEPYVYVQTYNDIYKLTRPLLELAHRDPRFYHLVGHIIRPSPYPLPWILGDFPHVGYYEHDNNPAELDADFLLVEESKIPEVEKKLQDSYFTEPLTVRPYQDTSKLYLRASVFQNFFPGRLPDFIGPENNKASAMRLLSAGLIYVAVSTVAALLLGENAGGLNWSISFVSLIIGATGAIAAFFLMPPSPQRSRVAATMMIPWQSIAPFGFVWLDLFSRFSRFVPFAGSFSSMARTLTFSPLSISATSDCILPISRLSPMAMSLWPESPIYVYSKLRYPAGIDLFNGILTNLGFDLRPQLHSYRASGITVATFYALYRWGGTFTVAGFLFNGGIAGYAFLQTTISRLSGNITCLLEKYSR